MLIIFVMLFIAVNLFFDSSVTQGSAFLDAASGSVYRLHFRLIQHRKSGVDFLAIENSSTSTPSRPSSIEEILVDTQSSLHLAFT